MIDAGHATSVESRGPVFISYRQSDGTPVAVAMAWALRAAGVPVWHDETDLPPGDTERRLDEALASGLSGALLIVTPEIEHSRVVREIELPRLLDLERDMKFTLALGSTVEVEGEPGQLDYGAPDRLLRQSTGTLARFDQRPVATDEQRGHVAAALCRRRMEQVRPEVAASGGLLALDVQTRIPPFAARLDGHIVLRLRPPVDGERRPHPAGLEDLREFLGQLPQLVAIAGATGIRVRGGAHLSVACALGAALPTTFVGTVEVVDTRGEVWTLTGQAPAPAGETLVEPVTPAAYNYEHGPVFVYVDLLPQRSDAAWEDLLAAGETQYAGALHLRPRQAELLEAGDAASLVGELNSAIRAIADKHRTTETHLMLRCPYPVALLLGRTLNTFAVHLYEWEDAPAGGAAGSTPRYLPSVVLRSGAGGSPIRAVTAPPSVAGPE